MSLKELNKKYLGEATEVAQSKEDTAELSAKHTGIVNKLKTIRAEFLTETKKYGKEYSVQQAEKEADLAAKALVTKADEVMYSGNVGFGAEIVNDEITIANALDLTSGTQKFAFLDALSQGRRTMAEISNAKNAKLPILGEPGFMRGRNTYTTGPYPVINPNQQQRIPTGEVDITQNSLHYVTAIDYELQCLSVANILTKLQTNTGFFLNKSLASIIINADNDTNATGNINSDDQLATAGLLDGALDHRFIFDGGLRDVTLNDPNARESLGTLTVDDFTDLLKKVDGSTLPQDVIALMDVKTYYEFTKVVRDLQQDNDLSKGIITDGALGNYNGVDIFATQYIPESKAANGKVDTLPANVGNNDSGSIILVKRNAVQHGFACELETAIHRNSLEQGYVFEAATMFGFGVVTNKAGQGNYVVTGFGVTR